MITFETDTDEGVRKYFDYAKAAGMPVIVGTCKPGVLPRIENFVKRYDIRLAIHNHGPGDVFPSPYDALKAVQGMDPRMGLCIDVGHTVRTGTDVVRAVADAGPRLLDMHAKDLRDLRVAESQCIVGEGKIPIAAIFRQLRASRYQGFVNGYEIDATIQCLGEHSFAYMRACWESWPSLEAPATSDRSQQCFGCATSRFHQAKIQCYKEFESLSGRKSLLCRSVETGRDATGWWFRLETGESTRYAPSRKPTDTSSQFMSVSSPPRALLAIEASRWTRGRHGRRPGVLPARCNHPTNPVASADYLIADR